MTYRFDERDTIREIKPGLHGQQTVRKLVVEPTVDSCEKGLSVSLAW